MDVCVFPLAPDVEPRGASASPVRLFSRNRRPQGADGSTAAAVEYYLCEYEAGAESRPLEATVTSPACD